MRGTFISWVVAAGFGIVLAAPNAAAATKSLSAMDERLERVDSATRERYREILDEYRADIAARPFDVKLALERCDFLSEMISHLGEDPPKWADEVSEESDRCEQEASDNFKEHPELLLRKQDRLYGDESMTNAAKLLNSDLALWSTGQIAHLHASYARSLDAEGRPLAKFHALNALRFDEAADVRLIAARWLIREGEREQARAILMSPFDVRADSYYLIQKIRLLADINARDDVLQLTDRIASASGAIFNRAELVQSLLDVNAIDKAREQLAKLAEASYQANAVAFRRFMIEYKNGTPEEALTAYNALRDIGIEADPMLQYRLSLLSRSMALPWRARDLIGFAVMLALFVGCAAIASLAIGGVHYRGLVRRTAGREPVSTLADWSLTHAWYGLFIILTASIVAIYFVGPLQFDGHGWNWDQLLGSRKQISKIVVLESAILTAMALPIVWIAARNGTKFTERYSLLKACLIGAAIGFAFRLPSLPLLFSSFGKSIITQNTSEMVEAMLSIRNEYGLATVMLVTVVAAPIIEELLFRGVLLGAFSRHISFGWANVVQAAIFAALHVQPAALPILFFIGVVAGVLTRRANGLLPAMVMHATFNLVFVLFFVKS